MSILSRSYFGKGKLSMKSSSKAGLRAIAWVGALALLPLSSQAEPAAPKAKASGSQAEPASPGEAAAPAATGAASVALKAHEQEAVEWATQLGRELTVVMEGWIDTGSVSEDKLFSRLYFPVPDSDPPKYTTAYDALADRDFPAIQEKYLAKSSAVVFARANDINGYVPTHNLQFSQPLTQNRAVDLVNNRTKRIFGEIVGFAAARSEAPYLIQHYKRDTGEFLVDVSVPLRVRGRAWGCVRIGYKQMEK